MKNNDMELGNPGELEQARLRNAEEAVARAQAELDGATDANREILEHRLKVKKDELNSGGMDMAA